MSGFITSAALEGVHSIALRKIDRPDVLAVKSAGRVVVLDARDAPDPAQWPAAVEAIRGASLILTVRAPDENMARYAANMGSAGDSVLVIVCGEPHARAWRALVAMNQRSVGGFGHATRGAA